MGRIGRILSLAVSSIGLSYGQTADIAKVESPFRLVRDVVIKNDLRAATTVLSGFKYDPSEIQKPPSEDSTPLSIGHGSSLLNQNTIQRPAIVLDGFMVNDNSQRLNPVQFSTFGFFWQNRF